MIQNLTRQALAVALADDGAAADVSAHLNAAIPYGTIYYVCSTNGRDGAGAGLTTGLPFATIDFAIGRCEASKDDRIFVLPGHAENVATAGAITADVAGISIIGLGNGSNKPTLSFSGTAGTFAISANNVTVRNIRVTSTIDEVVKMFNVTGAYVTIENVEHFETASCQTLQFLLASAAADYLTVRNCYHYQNNVAAGTQKWIELVGNDNAIISDNVFILKLKNEAASHIISGSTAVVNATITRNQFLLSGGTSQTTVVNCVTGSTGIISYNVAGSSTGVATGGAFTGDAMYMFENKWADTAAASGLLAPAVDTDT